MHLGAFHKASKFKRLSSSRLPFFACILGPFTKQASSNAFPLQGFLFCVHLAAFRRASKFERLSSSRFRILCASWSILQSKQILAPILLEVSYSVCIGGLLQNKHIRTPFLFEVSYFVCIWGLLQYKKIQTCFLFEVSYLVCVLGPFTKQADSNAFPFRCLRYCARLGAFRKSKQIQTPFLFKDHNLCASWGLSQSKQIELPFFFEVSCLVCIWGPFTKQADSNAFPRRCLLYCARLGAFRKSKQIQATFLFAVPYLV